MAKGSDASLTQSGISAGVLTITDDSKQQELTGNSAADALASVNRDTARTDNSLKPIFNEQEVRAGFTIVNGLSQEVGTFLENRAREADSKKDAAKKKEEQAVNDNTLTAAQRRGHCARREPLQRRRNVHAK